MATKLWVIRRSRPLCNGTWNLYKDGLIAGVGGSLADALAYIQDDEAGRFDRARKEVPSGIQDD